MSYQLVWASDGLPGKNTISNPFAIFNKKFENREKNNEGVGGTFGTLNWYQGNASPFYGISYIYSNQLRFSLEYSPDLMERESSYMSVKSPLNFGMSYQINNYLDVSAQFLHGSQFSLSASVKTNPNRPPLKGGKDLAPVPMRKRNFGHVKHTVNQEQIIKKVLDVDGFEIHYLGFSDNSARIDVTNTKFRSTAQAVGRISSTLQRFTSDSIKTATISFRKLDLQVASYTVDLEKIANEQFNPVSYSKDSKSILAIDAKPKSKVTNEQNFSWGLGPYIAHRLFNPDLPLSMETGLELKGSYKLFPGLRLSGELRKSVLTNLTDNQRRSNSTLHRVHSDWPLYDFAGQDGHIHTLKISYLKNISSNIYARAHAGWLEPFFAGVGGEILFKPAVSPIALGIDVHYVQKRDYQMMFNLRDYKTTLGHVSLYYDAGGIFEVEINAGRYLAGDWGATTTISRKFGNGWEVGGYATLTDVPFDVFGEGSFDKAIYVSVPLDWIISSPNKTQRRLTLRPITRDGGAQLASSRKLYRFRKITKFTIQKGIWTIMEVIFKLKILSLLTILMACSNSHELETGEMRTIELIQQAINQSNKKELVLNVKIFTRELIDSVGSPILYVELENGQNGTLDLYPGNGIGDTWLAADGATITFKHGVLKSSRGMGDDLMGSQLICPCGVK